MWDFLHIYDGAHVLKPLYICHRIMAPMRLSTNTNLPFLKFDLTNCFWGKNYFSATTHARGSVEVSKWPEDHPLRHLFQSGGWMSTLSSSFITFSEREPLFWFLLLWNFWRFLSQRCIGVLETPGKNFRSFWRNLTISEEILWDYSFKSALCNTIVFKTCH